MKLYPGMAALKKTANFEYKQHFLNPKIGYNPKFSYESTVPPCNLILDYNGYFWAVSCKSEVAIPVGLWIFLPFG
jgi:hypothetical protein